MPDAMPLSNFLPHCFALGLGTGFLGGLLGIGGGVVIVPSLVLIFDAFALPLGIREAVATGLGAMVFTSLAAGRAQWRRGALEWPLLWRWTPGLMLGGLGAGTLASLLPEIALTRFLGAFLAAIAVILLTRWQPPGQRRHPEAAGTTALALGAGLLSGLAGIAGGNIIVPTLIFFNVSPVRAAAQSSALGVPVALAGALGYAVLPSVPLSGTLGALYLPAVAALAVGAMISAPQGVRLAHRVPALALRRAFAVLLLAAALRLISKTL